tara:strand:- start:657 stop:890 length:234 start_codon:yes stop_codon:yes gene_type:complete
MRKIYDFRCPEGHVFEKYIDDDIKNVPCEICKQESTRVVSCRGILLDPISGDFPSTTMKWARDRQVKIKAERKVAEA